MNRDCAILVVDDDDDVRGALAAFLEGAGYRVVEAEDGRAALERLRSSPPVCVVLLDLFMPIMNGWAFRAAQRQDPALADIPVVLVTADRRGAEHAAELGAVANVEKPIEFDRLLEQVSRLC